MNQITPKTLKETKDRLAQLGENPALSWTSSGYGELDDLSGGLVRGGVTLVGSRPAMGCTTFLLNMISRLVRQNSGSILFCSQSESGYELTARLLQIGMGVELSSLIDGKMPAQAATDACGEFLSSMRGKVKIESFSCFTIDDILDYCHRLPDLSLVVVDNLKRVYGPVNTWLDCTAPFPPSESTDTVLLALKDMAMSLNLPVIGTVCLHCSLERRKNKRPSLADLRKIDVPAELADQIIFLYRDGYYNIEAEDILECIVAKTAYGKPGTVKLKHNRELGVFEEIC